MSEYIRPGTLEQGLALLQQSVQPLSTTPSQQGAVSTKATATVQPGDQDLLRIIAGATDVYPSKVSQRTWQGGLAERWLDISAMDELASIEETEEHWRIGAMVTWSDLIAASLPEMFTGLKQAAREVGGQQIQNRATLVGNLCNASPAADGVPPLMCLDASVELSRAGGQRTLALADFLQGNRKTARRADELVTAIIVPRQSDSRHQWPSVQKAASNDGSTFTSSFYKLGSRRYLVISIVMASALIQTDAEGVITACHFAVGACAPVATRLHELEKALTGQSIKTLLQKPQALHQSDLAKYISPISDVRASADYRSQMVSRVLHELLERHSNVAAGRGQSS